MPTASPAETTFLTELNQHIPPGIDWKQGALDYIAMRLAEENGTLARRFHLTKPFYSACPTGVPINIQLQGFIRELSHFLNVLSLLNMPPETQFLDVACGSGWVVQFLAKLNLTVTGLDISPDMIALTQERLQLDSLPTVESDRHTKVDLLVHDMEAAPLNNGRKYDVAILESALHHFVNPIQTLRNIAASLNDQGVVIILEEASNGQGDQHYVDVMQQYNTLERPYTRAQMVSILNFAGLAESQFLYPINGFYQQTAGIAQALSHELQFVESWNIIVAAKTPGVLVDRLRLFDKAAVSGIPPAVEPPPAVPTPPPPEPEPVVPPAPTIAAATTPAPDEIGTGEVVVSEVVVSEVVVSEVVVSEIVVGEIGIKGEVQNLLATSKRIVQKTIAKLTRS